MSPLHIFSIRWDCHLLQLRFVHFQCFLRVTAEDHFEILRSRPPPQVFQTGLHCNLSCLLNLEEMCTRTECRETNPLYICCFLSAQNRWRLSECDDQVLTSSSCMPRPVVSPFPVQTSVAEGGWLVVVLWLTWDGVTQWNTYLQDKSQAAVTKTWLACTICCSSSSCSTCCLHSSSKWMPAALWMTPHNPPPFLKEVLAGFTIASSEQRQRESSC